MLQWKFSGEPVMSSFRHEKHVNMVKLDIINIISNNTYDVQTNNWYLGLYSLPR